MTTIRLLVTFRFDHCELQAGTVIAVPAELARSLILRGVAEMAEPERMVIEPQETRVASVDARANYGPPHRRGRPKKVHFADENGDTT